MNLTTCTCTDRSTTWSYTAGAGLGCGEPRHPGGRPPGAGQGLPGGAGPPHHGPRPQHLHGRHQVGQGAAIPVHRHLTTNGTLRDPCELPGAPPCNLDQSIFKGIFVRNLRWEAATVLGDQVPHGHLPIPPPLPLLLLHQPQHCLDQEPLHVHLLLPLTCHLGLPPGVPTRGPCLPCHRSPHPS